MVKLKVVRGDYGKARISDASYRLVYTEPANGKKNYRLQWVDQSDDPRAKAFSNAARDLFGKHNKNVPEDLPVHAGGVSVNRR